MASISRESNGRKTIQFKAGDGRRKSIRLGKVSMKTAREVKTRVEHISAANLAGHAVDDDTAKWLRSINDILTNKLADVGLTPHRQTALLGRFIADYIEQQSPTVKPATRTTWKQCQRLLLEHFGENTPLRAITEGHAIGWRTHLLTRHNSRVKSRRKLSESTIRKRCACARQFFEHAVRLRLIERNPFNSKRIPTSLPKPKQKAFIDTETANRIMDHLPDWQYRLLFALARWGGMRVPSEPAKLTWADVDWEQMRLTVQSPKTEHHEGHERRVIPIFPELVQPLQDAWDAAPEGATHVFPVLQVVTGSALRKPLIKAIRAAGVEQWASLWTALRATRDTELRETYPVHVCEAWLGHEDRVAKRNYTQVTDEHFQRGATEMASSEGGAKSGADSDGKVSHDAEAQKTNPDICRGLPHLAMVYEALGGDDRNRTCTP